MRIPSLAALVVLVLLSTGCATITKGTSQTVTVDTDPSGAACTLTREAKTLGVVNPTPGSVSIGKSSVPITVVCRKVDFLDAAGTLTSQFQAMTFGNVLFGGLIGVAVDAASGATHEYDPIVTITLIPVQFPDIAARDTFFDRMRTTLLREAAEVKARIEKQCSASQCEQELAAAEAGTKAKLAEIDQKQALAKVAGT
jgi:hypothetical protein